MEDLLQKIVDGEYKIQNNTDTPIAVASDGGTIAFVVQNGSEDRHTIYLDRRIGTETKDEFYTNAYPGKEGSANLGSNDELVGIVKAELKKEDDSS